MKTLRNTTPTMQRRAAMLATLAMGVALSGCTFVKMAPGAEAVRVIAAGQLPAGCERRGEVEVSVKDRLGPYERDEMRVRDELETLARNEAPGLSADTIQPKGPPADGGQRFIAFRCGALAPGRAAVAPVAPNRDGKPPAEAKTTPLKDE
ncbi:hypothetical protein BH11PSE14_BH11PSE14_08110 [soil metagenome]